MTGEDSGLVRAVPSGSEDALVQLYDRYSCAVYATARRLTTDRGLAEDVVQKTFLALWNRAEQYDPTMGSLPAWLLTIARNRTIDRLRAIGRRPPTVPISDVAPSDEGGTGTPAGGWARAGPSSAPGSQSWARRRPSTRPS